MLGGRLSLCYSPGVYDESAVSAAPSCICGNDVFSTRDLAALHTKPSPDCLTWTKWHSCFLATIFHFVLGHSKEPTASGSICLSSSAIGLDCLVPHPALLKHVSRRPYLKQTTAPQSML